jgi:N-acetyl-1-D-myo-inositol-2-amino-2-deoxy-alpha-D-glucopyranoside deacetylase
MGTLLLVHAHPDDEAIATGGVMLKAHRDGHRVVLVTCTRGEEGEIHNMDEAETRPHLAEVRTAELENAAGMLGVARLEFLGYRDSGMAGTPSNDNPESFHSAPLAEAGERLETFILEERPDVVVTYTSDGTYGHPDHIKAHHTTVAALDLAARRGFEPQKFYLQAIPRGWLKEMAKRAKEAGVDLEGPANTLIGTPDEDITTSVDVSEFAERKMEAFQAHRSQVDPNSPFATMQSNILAAAFGTEHFVLARGALAEERPERDLFDEVT